MTNCLIGFGSNLGERRQLLDEAVEKLAAHPKIDVVAVSDWLITKPIGGPQGQGEFLNGAALIAAELPAKEILSFLHKIEAQSGRTRTERWAAREIDLDLLLYGESMIDDHQTQIPHPRMATRRFVLMPAAEIAPDMIHPATGWTIKQLLDHLDSPLEYFAITGVCRAENAAVARRVASELSAQCVVDSVELDLLKETQGKYSPTDLQNMQVQRQRTIESAIGDTSATGNTNTRPVISGFWLPDLFSTSGISHESPAKPKLLFHLDSTTDWFVEYHLKQLPKLDRQTQGSWIAERHDRLRNAVANFREAPVIVLPADNQDRAVHELVSAIKAMK